MLVVDKDCQGHPIDPLFGQVITARSRYLLGQPLLLSSNPAMNPPDHSAPCTRDGGCTCLARGNVAESIQEHILMLIHPTRDRSPAAACSSRHVRFRLPLITLVGIPEPQCKDELIGRQARTGPAGPEVAGR